MASTSSNSGSGSGSEDPIENLKKKPLKGILKPSVSREEKDKMKNEETRSAKWDEMNIIKTFHPPNKSYGHMKVEEPKTPFERNVNEDDDEMDGGVNAEELKKRIEESGTRKSGSFQSEEESEDEESPEDKIAREVFEKKRKEHYNEFQAAKMLAKQMMDEEEANESENDNNDKN